LGVHALGRILRYAIVSDGAASTTKPAASLEASGTPSSVTADAAKNAAAQPTSLRAQLRHAWQIPLLLAGAVGVAGAVWFARTHQPEHDFAAALEQASELISQGDADRAKIVLEEVVGQNLELAPDTVLPRFLALKADLKALSLGNIEQPGREFDESLVADFDAAKRAGWTLTPAQTTVYSKALVRLGKANEALAVAEESAKTAEIGDLRLQVKRDALEQLLAESAATPSRDTARLLQAIDEFRAIPGLPLEHLAWAAARAADLRIASGDYAEAADRLLVELGRLESLRQGTEASRGELESAALAELYGLRGEALRREGRFLAARQELEHAASLARGGSAIAGAIDISLGNTLLALGDASLAHATFDRAVLAQHEGSLAHEARLGRAEARLELDQFDDARVDIAALCEAGRRKSLHNLTIEGLEAMLVARAREGLAESEFSRALELAEFALSLAEVRSVDPDALLIAATAAREDADRRMAEAGGGRAAIERMSPEDRATLHQLLHRAAERFVAYAATPACRNRGDQTFTECLRRAAQSYDESGWPEQAVAQCERLLAELPLEDPDRAEAYLRIAAIREAAGAFGDAAENYLRAINVRREGSEYTARAIVPLARALEADGRGGEAIAHLQRVLAGEYGLKPDALEYFHALDLLAKIHFAAGRAAEAAELLHEAVARCPDPSRLGELRFRLGEAYVAVARAARDASTKDDVTVAAKARMTSDAENRFREARRVFDAAIEAIEQSVSRAGAAEVGPVAVEATGEGESKNATRLTTAALQDGLVRDMLREAYLRRADCAYDLALLKSATGVASQNSSPSIDATSARAFEDCIALYEAVERKFPDHPSTMVALIQIVNACDHLGDRQRAETAHRRAQLRLAQLPDSAFFGGAGILSRESWETWLRNHPPAGRPVTAAADEKSGGVE
jgi:tetratricopeptide (TPR) repeat protein